MCLLETEIHSGWPSRGNQMLLVYLFWYWRLDFNLVKYCVSPRWRRCLRHCATKPEGRGFDPRRCHWNFSFLPAALWPWGWLSLYQKWVPGIFPGGLRRPVRKGDNLTTFMCRLSWNLGASNFWNPQCLSRAVMGFLYLLLCVSV